MTETHESRRNLFLSLFEPLCKLRLLRQYFGRANHDRAITLTDLILEYRGDGDGDADGLWACDSGTAQSGYPQ